MPNYQLLFFSIQLNVYVFYGTVVIENHKSVYDRQQTVT